jgi:hypothetical protein
MEPARQLASRFTPCQFFRRCRVRPPPQRSECTSSSSDPCLHAVDDRTVRYAGPIAYSTAPPVFGFQRVFVPSTPSHDVYSHAVERIALDVVEGFNGSILTYGQTGSGKTFTTLGLLPRVADTLFQVRRHAAPLSQYVAD